MSQREGFCKATLLTRERFNFIWETAAIFAAILALLFWRFSSQGAVFRWGVLLVALVLMLVVTYRRLRRLHEPRGESRDQDSPPFGPPPSLPPE